MSFDFADVHKLTEILRRLTEDGNTVIVIEHNLDVIKTADYIIDIGPEAVSYTHLIQIAYYAGLRIGEACGLAWQDVNLEEQCLSLIHI